jgi:hypothetical protein
MYRDVSAQDTPYLPTAQCNTTLHCTKLEAIGAQTVHTLTFLKFRIWSQDILIVFEMFYGYKIIFGMKWKCDFKKHLASMCQGDLPRSVLKTATGNRSDHHRSVINIRVIKLSSANKGIIHLRRQQIFTILIPTPFHWQFFTSKAKLF